MHCLYYIYFLFYLNQSSNNLCISNMRKLLALVAAIVTGISAHATDIYMRGGMNGWTISDDWKFATTDNNIYHIDNVTISASDDWKIASEDWSKVRWLASAYCARNVYSPAAIVASPSNSPLAELYVNILGFTASLE